MVIDITQETEQFFQAVENAKNVIVGTHLNPDGDTIGSGLALSFYLDQINIPNQVLCHNEPPKNLRFLPNIKKVRQVPTGDDFDLGIVVDTNDLDRLGSINKYFENCANLAVIDHHIPHTKPGNIRVIDSTASATALLITRIFKKKGIRITSDMATCLLTGIFTDTGSFRYTNTTTESLNLSAELVTLGANINHIADEVFHKRPMPSMRLLGRSIDIMKTSHENRIAWVCLSKNVFDETEALEEYSEGIANELLSIEGVQIAILFREFKPGIIRISLRSRCQYDVSLVATEFNGGGHKNASGCTIRSSIKDAEQAVVESAIRCLELS